MRRYKLSIVTSEKSQNCHFSLKLSFKAEAGKGIDNFPILNSTAFLPCVSLPTTLCLCWAVCGKQNAQERNENRSGSIVVVQSLSHF